MDEATKKHIIGAIKSDLSDRFRVIDNTGTNRQIVAGLFPDVLLMRQEPPKNDDVLFVMRIEGQETDLANSIAIWKELERSEVSFDLVVPDAELHKAKQLASAIDVSAKFAHYTINHQGKARVSYE